MQCLRFLMAKRLVGYLLLSQVVCLRFNVFYYLMVIQSCYIIQVNNGLRVTIELPRECEMSTDPETRFCGSFKFVCIT